MDTVQMLGIAAAVLGVAVLVLVAMFISTLRVQQRTARQAARRALEDERRRRALSDLMPRSDPDRKPRKPRKSAAATPALATAEAGEPEGIDPGPTRAELLVVEESILRRERELEALRQAAGRDAAAAAAALATVQQREAALVVRGEELAAAEAAQRRTLAELAGLSVDEARAELMAHVEKESRLHAAQLSRDLEAEARRHGEAKARQIIVGAIQRMAAEQTTESVIATVVLPSDEMKGRIIGREGRNIRAFEQVTGVNVLIDDTPESVLISCFDPVRRETARLTLAELVADGRIHPARIEEVYERSRRQIDELCQRAAEDALLDMEITDLDPGLVPYLGALRFRTSYGQNVLAHLVESGHLAALMASELGLDPELCKRAAFLHDIGKSLSHEVEGSHAAVGADLARRFGEHPDIVHAIEAHHNEVEPRTVEAVLTQAADAISGSRPGARRESLEIYVKRLQRLEEIAKAHVGVSKVFAMQAGREVRVMVAPEQVSDAESVAIAHEIAREVEGELTYPGSIKVTVVRESRAVALAR